MTDRLYSYATHHMPSPAVKRTFLFRPHTGKPLSARRTHPAYRTSKMQAKQKEKRMHSNNGRSGDTIPKKTDIRMHPYPGLPLPEGRKRIMVIHKNKSEYRPSERKQKGILAPLVIFG